MSRTTPDLVTFACEMSGISFASTFRHVFASIPACRKGELWHGFAHGHYACFNRRGIVSQHVQPGPKGNHFDLNLLANLSVMRAALLTLLRADS